MTNFHQLTFCIGFLIKLTKVGQATQQVPDFPELCVIVVTFDISHETLQYKYKSMNIIGNWKLYARKVHKFARKKIASRQNRVNQYWAYLLFWLAYLLFWLAYLVSSALGWCICYMRRSIQNLGWCIWYFHEK